MYTPHLGRLWVQNSLGWPWTLRMFLFSIFLVKFTLQVSGFLGKLCICSINCKLPLLHLFWWAQVELTWKTRFLCPSFSSVLLLRLKLAQYPVFGKRRRFRELREAWELYVVSKKSGVYIVRNLIPGTWHGNIALHLSPDGNKHHLKVSIIYPLHS